MTDTLFTRAFWAAAGGRAIRTLAQSAVSVVVVGGATGLLDADWKGVVSAAALATILSVLTSVAGNAVSKTGPSFTSTEVVVPSETPVLTEQSTSRDVELGDPRDVNGDGRDDTTGRFV